MLMPRIREYYGLIVNGFINRALPVIEATPDERARVLARLDRFPPSSRRPAAGPHLIRLRHASEPTSDAQRPARAVSGDERRRAPATNQRSKRLAPNAAAPWGLSFKLGSFALSNPPARGSA